MTVARAPHAARIHWTPEQQHLGLPQAMRGIDPAWPANSVPTADEGWSLAYEFDRAPADQGNPSQARVHFVMPAAPHHELRAGARLLLFERATSRYATLELLD
jgi:hypothetical protein